MLSHLRRPGSARSSIQPWAEVIGEASTTAMIDLPPAPSVSASPERWGNHHRYHYKKQANWLIKNLGNVLKTSKLETYLQLKRSDSFLVWPLLSVVSPAARPPSCSKWTHSLQYFTPRSLPLSPCHNATAGIDRDPSQSSLDFKTDIASKDIRKAFRFWNDFPQPSLLHPVQDRLAQPVFRWPLHGCDMVWGWPPTWRIYTGTKFSSVNSLGKMNKTFEFCYVVTGLVLWKAASIIEKKLKWHISLTFRDGVKLNSFMLSIKPPAMGPVGTHFEKASLIIS